MEIPIVGDYPSLPYRNHLSRERIELKDIEYEQPTFFKPSGFWYALGAGWIELNGYSYPELGSNYLYELTLKDDDFVSLLDEHNIDKILTINSLGDLLHFELLYNRNPYGTVQIDWQEVAEKYGGIEFRYDCFSSGKRNNPKSLWYYALDLTSGCLWSYNILKRMNLNLIVEGTHREIEDHNDTIVKNKQWRVDPLEEMMRKIMIRLDPESSLASYIDYKKSEISESTVPQRIILVKDGQQQKLSLMLLHKVQIDRNSDFIDYEYYKGDVSLLKPKGENVELRQLIISEDNFTDVDHPNQNKILRLSTLEDIFKLQLAYRVMGANILYDSYKVDFNPLLDDFGGIDVNIIGSGTENQRLSRRMGRAWGSSGGVIWNSILINKIKV